MIDQPSQAQLDYVDGLRRKLRLSRSLLDSHCQATHGVPFVQITKQQCHALLDEMIGWKAIPAQLMVEAGQVEMFR